MVSRKVIDAQIFRKKIAILFSILIFQLFSIYNCLIYNIKQCVNFFIISQDTFLKAGPVKGGIGKALLCKMGWREGTGLGRHEEGSLEPLLLDFKVDRRGF